MLNIIFCVTLRTLQTTLKGVNMEFEVELWDFNDLDLELGENDKLIVEWESNIEYSPDEGVYDKFCWNLCILTPQRVVTDITDKLSIKDIKFIEKEIERACQYDYE